MKICSSAILCLLAFAYLKAHGAAGWFWVGAPFPWVFNAQTDGWYYVFEPEGGLEVQVEGTGDSEVFPITSPTWIYADASFPWFWSAGDDALFLADLPQGQLWTYSDATDSLELMGIDTQGTAVAEVVESTLEEYGLSGAVFGVWEGDTPLVVSARGHSMTDVPATPSMYFRVGGPGINALINVFLQAVDDKLLSVDDTLDMYFPELVNANQVTLQMLANCTAGYADYVFTDAFIEAFYGNIFRSFTADELIQYSMDESPTYTPGTDWGYSHTTFVILGEVLAQVYERPFPELLQEKVFAPLGMTETAYVTTPAMPEPTLHGFTTEREVFEDSTYWNPSWTSYTGSLAATVSDIGKLARGVFSTQLISADSLALMVAPTTVGLGPNTQARYYAYGVGVVNGWYIQNPNFGGYQGAMAYDPNTDTTIVVYCTLGQSSDPGTHHGMLMYTAIREALGL